MTRFTNKYSLPIHNYFVLNKPLGVKSINNRTFLIFEEGVLKLFSVSPNKLNFVRSKVMNGVKDVVVYKRNIIKIICENAEHIFKIKDNDFKFYEGKILESDLVNHKEHNIFITHVKHSTKPLDNMYKVVVSFKEPTVKSISTLTEQYEQKTFIGELNFL